MRLSWLATVSLAAGSMLCVGVASSQPTSAGSVTTYPNRPIRFVTSEPGGSGDIASRLLVPGMSASLGQAVVVDNRPSVIIAGEIVAKAPPDGHTLITYGGTLWLG